METDLSPRTHARTSRCFDFRISFESKHYHEHPLALHQTINPTVSCYAYPLSESHLPSRYQTVEIRHSLTTMDQLFRPSNTDPTASKANTLPYVDNICQYLSSSSAEWYRGLMKCFEEGTSPGSVLAGEIGTDSPLDRFDEKTLELLVRAGHFFDGQPYVQYHHEDLVMIIILNKLDDSTVQAANHTQEPNADNNPTQKSNPNTVRTDKQIKEVRKTQATATSATVPQTPRRTWKRSIPCEVCRRQKKRCKHLNPPAVGATAPGDTK